MKLSLKDLENMSRSANEALDRKAQDRGKRLAKDVANATSQGRGLWIILLWPSWILFFAFSGYLFQWYWRGCLHLMCRGLSWVFWQD